MFDIPKFQPALAKIVPYPTNHVCLLTTPKKHTRTIYKPTINLKNYGPNFFAINLTAATLQNASPHLPLWIGRDQQITLMNIAPYHEMGVDVHPDTEKFIYIISGYGMTTLGDTKDSLNIFQEVAPGYALMIPANMWHNLINIGNEPLKAFVVHTSFLKIYDN